jgi:hypothetical protein
MKNISEGGQVIMIVKHGDHKHEVHLKDDGTLTTLVKVDGVGILFFEAERDISGEIRPSWLRDAAKIACNDGLVAYPGDEDVRS